jgi:hypothetical protein
MVENKAMYKEDEVFILVNGEEYIGINRIPKIDEKIMVINEYENNHDVYTAGDLHDWHECSVRVKECSKVFSPSEFVVLKKA